MDERSPEVRRLLQAAQAGEPLDLARPAGDEAEGRGELPVAALAELCLGADVERVDARKGLEVRHARLVGAWDAFAGATLGFPLAFRDCVFDEVVDLSGLTCQHLELERCRLPALVADEVACSGDLVLTRCEADRFGLHKAMVGGDLDLSRSRLAGLGVKRRDWQEPRLEAIHAEGVEVRGDLDLRFLETGAGVNLRRSTVGGRISALGARMVAPAGPALRLEETTVGRNVDLKFGFVARGGVDARRLRLGGNLDCRGAGIELSAEALDRRPVLDLRDARVGGDVLLKAAIDGKGMFRRFRATGRVTLYRATVDGSLECHGALLEAASGAALDLEEARVAGSVLLDVYRPQHQPHRTSGDGGGGDPEPERFETSGPVSVRRARIGLRLSATGARLNLGEGRYGVHALLADGARVEGNVDLHRDLATGMSFEAGGIVDLDRAVLGGSLDLGGAGLYADEEQPDAPFPHPDRHRRLSRALVMRDARVAHSVYLCPAKVREGDAAPGEEVRFRAVGRVNLCHSEIGGDLSCRRACFERRLPPALLVAEDENGDEDEAPRVLNLNDLRVAGNLDLRESSVCLRTDAEAEVGRTAEGERRRAGEMPLAVSARGVEVAGTAWLDRLPEEGCAGSEWALFLEGASIGKWLVHRPRAWPAAGRLHLDGLTYGRLDLHRVDEPPAESLPPRRWVDWLSLQRPPFTGPVSGASADGAWHAALSPELWDRGRRERRARRHLLRHSTVQPHERLVEVLRGAGEWEAARAVAIHKRRMEIARLHPLVAAAYRAFQWPVGYGYHPWRVLFLMFAFYVFGVGMFAWADAEGAMVPAETSLLVQQHVERHHGPDGPTPDVHFTAENYPPFEPLVYAADTFLPIIDLHQEHYWLAGPVPRPDAGAEERLGLKRGWEELLRGDTAAASDTLLRNRFRVYLWLHIAAGWLLTTIAVAGLSGLVKTD